MEIPVWMTATIPGGAGGVSTAAVITSRTVSQAHRAKSFKSSRWWRKYAKNIIDGLGGTITVSSQVGDGTEMRIELPGRVWAEGVER